MRIECDYVPKYLAYDVTNAPLTSPAMQSLPFCLPLQFHISAQQ